MPAHEACSTHPAQVLCARRRKRVSQLVLSYATRYKSARSACEVLGATSAQVLRCHTPQ